MVAPLQPAHAQIACAHCMSRRLEWTLTRRLPAGPMCPLHSPRCTHLYKPAAFFVVVPETAGASTLPDLLSSMSQA